MEITPNTFLFATIAYIIGSFSTAIITCKVMGIEDPRTTGSHNPGATNVLRHGGKKAAAITLLGDMLKGFIPVWLITFLPTGSLTPAIVGLFAFLGHIFPLYYGFKGGKGIATYYGVILALNWQVGLISVAIWLLIAKVLKISSLSALVSIFATPIILYLMTQDIAVSSIIALMSLTSIWRHKSNIRQLLQGTEDKISNR